MATESQNKGINPVSLIDDLIIEISYMKDGQPPSLEKFKQGTSLIESILNIAGAPNKQSTEDKSCFSLVQTKKRLFFDEAQIINYKGELEKIKVILETISVSKTQIPVNELEILQELLLKISLPIWKEQIKVLKPNQFKFIEL
jgi:hypothetical protein